MVRLQRHPQGIQALSLSKGKKKNLCLREMIYMLPCYGLWAYLTSNGKPVLREAHSL